MNDDLEAVQWRMRAERAEARVQGLEARLSGEGLCAVCGCLFGPLRCANHHILLPANQALAARAEKAEARVRELEAAATALLDDEWSGWRSGFPASLPQESTWRGLAAAVTPSVILGRVCGDVEASVALVVCECGQLRQHDRPHGYTSPEHAPTVLRHGEGS